MAYVYRYTDLEDGIIKYVGIVWGANRTLKQRLDEHYKQDNWCSGHKYKIEYIDQDINNRTDAEYFEAHYISLYHTDDWYNKSKSGWGISKYLPDREKDWKEFKFETPKNIDDYIKLKKIYESKAIEKDKEIKRLEDRNETLRLLLRKSEHEKDDLLVQLKNYKQTSKDYDNELLKKIVAEEAYYQELQTRNSTYIKGSNANLRIFTQLIWEFDREIYNKYCNGLVDIALELAQCRNKIVCNFMGSNVLDEKYQLWQEDLERYKRISTHKGLTSRPIKVTHYSDGKFKSHMLFSSITEASKQLVIPFPYLTKALEHKIICKKNDTFYYYDLSNPEDCYGGLNWCIEHSDYTDVYIASDIDEKNIFRVIYEDKKNNVAATI